MRQKETSKILAESIQVEMKVPNVRTDEMTDLLFLNG
jgi:hypothetical protein